MKKMLFCPILLLAAGTLALAADAPVPAEKSDAKARPSPRVVRHDKEWWNGLSDAQKEEFEHLKMSDAEKCSLDCVAPGKLFYDGDIPFAYLPLAERWKILRDRRISFYEYRYNEVGRTLDSANGRINPTERDVLVAELTAKRQLVAAALRNALEVCATPEECRAAAEEVKNFILDIIVGDADWRERRAAAETAQIIAETPEGDTRERDLKRCREYYEKRRIAVAEAERDMGDKLSENYVRLLFRAFPNDWESVIREFDASLLLRQKPRERLRFVSETFRKDADPTFPQENRLALERIREAEIELRKKLP